MALQRGGLNPALVAKAFGHERKNFLEMVELQDDVGDFIEKINNLLTNYNISQGSLARSVKIHLSFLLFCFR